MKKIILVTGVLTALGGCSEPMGSYYPARLNGLAVTSQENASDANKHARAIAVNNREMTKVNEELKIRAESAETSARQLSGKR